MRSFVALLLCATFLASCGPGCDPCFSAGTASQRIQKGMTEAQSIEAVGWNPTSTEMSVCGMATRPFPCKTNFFGYSGNQLVVIYEPDPFARNAFYVNSWQVFNY